ncbi:MAG: SPFH domain-containing protein [Pseudomonadota bacterium]
MNAIHEKQFKALSGWMPLLLILGMIVGVVLCFAARLPLPAVLLIGAAFILGFGFVAIAPNDARVLLLFGEYKGSIIESGFFWVNPFFSKKKISLRVRNFETGAVTMPQKKNSSGTVVQEKTRTAGRPSKVNDKDGNPIEISAVVVWKVVDTAEAMFEVDDYEDYVAVQSEAALRNLASRYAYDGADDEESLRGNTTQVGEELRKDIQERLGKAGVEAIEARISHLAYAAEIAAAMLQRQQASAVVSARTKIVEGAVGMVQMALDELKEQGIVELDDERRAAMVSNLLVVLCSDKHTQPVVNTGSLYS